MRRRARRIGHPQLGFAIAWSALVAGCSSAAAPPPSDVPRTTEAHASEGPAGSEASPPSERPPADAQAEPGRAPASTEPEAPVHSSSRELSRFHAALHGLETKSRKDHVRVLWLGDSHGQADFWSGQLRKLLSDRFGKAGPGFVHLGYKNYRHDGVKLSIDGRWRMRPKKPVSPKRQGDGIYGLGGLMMSGYADMPRVELTLTDAIPGGKVRYDICYRFVEPGDALATRANGKPEETLFAKGDRGKVKHLELVASAGEPLVVRPIGRTDLCGVVAEADPAVSPGVVVDTLAINGARYGTALAWEEEAWKAEVARRKPDLVVLEYGTNEAGDASPAFAKVKGQVGELLGRVRKVAPEVDCVVVSPTDRGDAEENVAAMREGIKAAAKDQGCYFFDAWQILGGQGAFTKLSEQPDAKVQKDKIHLTIKGYRELGQTMFDAVIDGYGKSDLIAGKQDDKKNRVQ